MIELTPSAALMLYLLMTLSFVLGLWGYSHYKTRSRKIFTAPKELYICEYCTAVYMDEAHQSVTKCPECQSFNKGNRFQK